MLKIIKTLKNPLLDFHISSMEAPLNLDPDLWKLFNAYSFTKTQNAALQSLSPKIRKVLLKSLKAQSLSCWSSKEMWQNWPEIVDDSGLYAYYGQQQHFHMI